MARSSRLATTLAAYVLHRYDWSETSLILDLFTREQGRVAVAAKGAKRPYSQLRPVLLPFQRLSITLGKLAAGDEAVEVQTLRQAEWGGGAPVLGGAALFSGFYCNELLMKLLARHDPQPRLFDAYAETLPALQAGGDIEQAALRAFELTLLREAGLLPELNALSASGEPLAAGGAHALRPEAGVVEIDPDADEPLLPAAALLALEAALQHGSGAALRQACAPVLPALRSQLRRLLHYHLGGPPLRTRQVLLDVQRLLDAPSR